MHLAGTLKAFHRVVVAAARIAGKGKDLSIKLLDGGSGCLAWFRGHLEGEFLARVLFHTWATPVTHRLLGISSLNALSLVATMATTCLAACF